MTHHQEHGHQPDDQSALATAASAELAELLDLDGEVLSSYLHQAMDWVRELAGDLPGDRVLDLGCGTGTASIALARRFTGAEVIALDASEYMLTRVQAKARELSLTDRIHPVRADLDLAWPAIDTLDVVWASMSLHHLADPDRVLDDVFAAINPGGILAVAEMQSQLRFLPDDIGLGRPGLEARCQAVLAELHAEQVPELGSDWRSRLVRAGFVIDAERVFGIDLRPPLPAASARYAQASLRRVRAHIDDRLTGDDLATLDTLTSRDGPQSLLQRTDLHLRTTREVYIARRPNSSGD